MSEKYKFHDPEGMYFVTSTVVYWIDLFTRKEYKHILIRYLRYYQEKRGLIIHAWCIMPSHIHLIISSKGASLSDIMRDFKKITNIKIVEEIDLINESRENWLIRAFKKAGKALKRIQKNKVWQDGTHPILLDTASLMQEKLDYVHNNPVESEVVG